MKDKLRFIWIFLMEGSIRNTRLLLISLLLVSALSSCSASNLMPPMKSSQNVRVEYISPDLTHASLWEGNILFGGISSKEAEWGVDRLKSFSRVSSANLNNDFNFIRITPFDSYFSTIGENRFTQYNQMFRELRKIEDDALGELAELIPEVRYVIFSRIEFDHSNTSKSSSPDYGEPGSFEEHHSVRVSRTMDVYAIMYDLRAKAEVWKGRAHSSLYRVTSYETEPNASMEESIVNGLFSGDPDLPTDAEMFEAVFKTISRKLPTPCEEGISLIECGEIKKKLRAERENWRKGKVAQSKG